MAPLLTLQLEVLTAHLSILLSRLWLKKIIIIKNDHVQTRSSVELVQDSHYLFHDSPDFISRLTEGESEEGGREGGGRILLWWGSPLHGALSPVCVAVLSVAFTPWYCRTVAICIYMCVHMYLSNRRLQSMHVCNFLYTLWPLNCIGCNQIKWQLRTPKRHSIIRTATPQNIMQSKSFILSWYLSITSRV